MLTKFALSLLVASLLPITAQAFLIKCDKKNKVGNSFLEYIQGGVNHNSVSPNNTFLLALVDVHKVQVATNPGKKIGGLEFTIGKVLFKSDSKVPVDLKKTYKLAPHMLNRQFFSRNYFSKGKMIVPIVVGQKGNIDLSPCDYKLIKKVSDDSVEVVKNGKSSRLLLKDIERLIKEGS